MEENVLVFGHKNPDNDAVSAAVGYAYLKNAIAKQSGIEQTYEACRLGVLPAETSWLLGECSIDEPRLIESVPEGANVILVDHNEALQSASGIEGACITEIVDHHRLGGLTTAQPLRFNARPVGSTAAIVAHEFEVEGIELPQNIAKLLLSAMLTDTVIMKSPTTTNFDRDVIQKTAKYVGVDPVDFGMQIFKCRSNPAEIEIDKLVNGDAKEFELSGEKVYIGQYETVDLPAVLAREAEIRECMTGLVEAKGYKFVLFFATDILKEGSQFICEGDTQFVSDVFGVDLNGKSQWMPGVLSRKKQVAAPILAACQIMFAASASAMLFKLPALAVYHCKNV